MLRPGTRLGGLEIGELLGRGAMGEVYRAEQVSLKRPVAVKRIAAHLADRAEIVQRFEREAQCIAKVQHPNVLSVYEFGRFTDDEDDEHVLLVMELVEGGCNLKEFLARPMDWRLATSVIMQVADGLAAAAEHGIVHRDIKPDNIMISNKGIAKLADFGLAKSSESVGMTISGSVLGTPNYMPPEACMGEEVQHPGDLYSLGATWFHCLTGQPPFRGANTMMILRAHVEEEPPPVRELNGEVPRAVARLVHACLAKKPEDRPESAEALAAAIHDLGREVPRTVAELMQTRRIERKKLAESATVVPEETTRPTVEVERPDDGAPTLPGTAAGEPPVPRRRGRGLALAAVVVLLGGALAAAAILLGGPGEDRRDDDGDGGESIAGTAAGDPQGAGGGETFSGGTSAGEETGGAAGDGDEPEDGTGTGGDPDATEDPGDGTGLDEPEGGGGEDPEDGSDSTTGGEDGRSEEDPDEGGDPDPDTGEDPGDGEDAGGDGGHTDPEGGEGEVADPVRESLDELERAFAATDFPAARKALAALDPLELDREAVERRRALSARLGEQAAEYLREAFESASRRAEQGRYGEAVEGLSGVQAAAALCGGEERRRRLIALLQKAEIARNLRERP